MADVSMHECSGHERHCLVCIPVYRLPFFIDTTKYHLFETPNLPPIIGWRWNRMKQAFTLVPHHDPYVKF